MDMVGLKAEQNDDSCSQEENKCHTGLCDSELNPGQAAGTPESPTVTASAPVAKASVGQLRTSARVSKKLRLDSTSSAPGASGTTSPAPVPLGDRKDVVVKEELGEDTSAAGNTRPRSKRPFEPWSVEGKDWFFEALNEYGKDYDAIRTHYALRMRKRGLPEHLIKNKDQIRHFYYRTWNKISKYLKFSDDMSKVAQELYGLINYGELRKKIAGPFTEKCGLRLNELVFYGATQLRVRGKTVRVKTPICRALRRLHLEEGADCPEDLRLPTRVTVELRPSDNMAWTRVHAAAQNPRVRTTVLLQRRLSSLISFLQQRWRLPQERLRDELLQGDESTKRPLLRLRPPPDVHIALPSVNAGEYVTSSSLSLQRYEERMLPPSARGVPPQTASTPTRGGKGSGKGSKRFDSGEEAVVGVPSEEVSGGGGGSGVALPPEELAVERILELGSQVAAEKGNTEGEESQGSEAWEKRDEEGVKKEEVPKKEEGVKKEEATAVEASVTVAAVRKGWTLEDVGTLTIGELYLMIGSEGKIHLDYLWDDPEGEGENNNILTSMLQKLVSIARLTLTKSEFRCPCGHVCGRRGSSRGGSTSSLRGGGRVAPRPTITTLQHPRIEAYSDKVGHFSTVQKPTDEHLAQPIAWGAPPPPPPINPLGSRMLYREGAFRRPPLAPSRPLGGMDNPGAAAEAFKAQLDKFRPKYCNRRGRSVRKSVVVQRMLPLLPKAPTAPPHAFMTLKVIPQTSQLSGEFAPLAPSPGPSAPIFTSEPAPQLHNPHNQPSTPILLQSIPSLESQTVSSTGALDLPLAGPSFVGLLSGTEDDGSSKERMVLSSSSEISNVVGVREEPGSSEGDACVTPPSSPSRILGETDGQWINSEVADFSLSSFLGHLDSPLKSSTVTPAAAEDTRLSSDVSEVEAQLQCLMSENSVDYMAKFADLAAQIASDVSAKK